MIPRISKLGAIPTDHYELREALLWKGINFTLIGPARLSEKDCRAIFEMAMVAMRQLNEKNTARELLASSIEVHSD